MRLGLKLLFLMFPILASTISAQSPPLYRYQFSQEIKSAADSGALLPIRAAWNLTYIGEVDAAIRDYPVEVELFDDFSEIAGEDSLRFEKYRPAEAVEYLLERARNEQIIIINEAHIKPMHRMLPRRMLRGLFDQGFRYLGIEALMLPFEAPGPLTLDSTLNERGYPLASPITGSYTQEPVMGNLVREAVEIGFTLFGYDRVWPDSDLDREEAQAENIKRILDSDPEAKILIHCGYWHLLEGNYPNGARIAMAEHLKLKTGIDPLTVEQDQLSERYTMPESPYRSLINAEIPSVLLDEKGDAFNGFGNSGRVDIAVYHPATVFKKGRPTWLLLAENSGFYTLDPQTVEIECPCLVKAWPEGEPPEAVPADLIELKEKTTPKALVLKPGAYQLQIENAEGEKQFLTVRRIP